MKRLFLPTTAGMIAGLLIVVNCVGPLIAQESERTKSPYEQLNLFGDIFEHIRKAYIENVDDEKLIRNAINGMLTGLDPHSSYLPPHEFDNMQIQTRGEFGGLGIEVTQENGFVKVVSPIDDTPADRAGIKAGDFITKVDGESTLGMSLNDAVDKMRGQIGSEIIITIVREDIEEPFDFKIMRDTIKVKATSAHLEGDMVVLRITSFTDQTYKDLVTGIKNTVEKAGGIDEVKGFVIDLRNNPGGLLKQAILVSDAFLEKGEIVSTQGRNKGDNKRANATLGDLAAGKPIVVLINGGSASASEIVAGALQDHKRAVIVGTRSFGKGSVQTIMPLRSDGAIRLTTARYYTPSGRSIQNLGVLPDVIVKYRLAKNTDDVLQSTSGGKTKNNLRKSLKNGALAEAWQKQFADELDSQHKAASLWNRDNQLAYALNLLRGMAILNKNL